MVDCATKRLVGGIEANLVLLAEPDRVNVSYWVFQAWRGRGLASRALHLLAEYLKASTDVQHLVLRVSPENAQSLRVAETSGFTSVGTFDEPGGQFVHFSRSVR
jgi:RimJ/RimL family protein N-acetyltransferase